MTMPDYIPLDDSDEIAPPHYCDPYDFGEFEWEEEEDD